MWPIMPSYFPPKLRVKTCGFNIWKMLCDGSTHFAYFKIPDKKWMGKNLLWGLDIIQELIWKVWQNSGVFGIHQPLHIPHFVLLKAIHLTPYPWRTLVFMFKQHVELVELLHCWFIHCSCTGYNLTCVHLFIVRPVKLWIANTNLSFGAED